MRFENKLEPFTPEYGLRVKVLDAADIEFDFDFGDMVKHFGFKKGAMQVGFFKKSTGVKGRRVVGLLYTPGGGRIPHSMLDPRVVCRLFGTLDRDGSLELWHISTNALNPLNDSLKGTRWGIHNLISHADGKKTFWTSSLKEKVTRTNAPAHVRGTPNPYAVECLVRCVEFLGCPSVRQHDAMPCTKLFSGYDQKTHPATMLIYKALQFTRPPELDEYSWFRGQHPSLIYSYTRMVQSMTFGLSVV
jgi:hypothetical protein